MNGAELIEYNKSELTVRTERDLPNHIKFEQYQELYYMLDGSDQFLCGLLFETGGRVSDVISLRWCDIDVQKRQMKMFVDKRDINITLPISEALVNDFKNIMAWTKPNQNDFIFNKRNIN